MYTETAKNLERALKDRFEKIGFNFLDKNLKLAYQIICKAERIKPGKVFFFNFEPQIIHDEYLTDFSGGRCLEFKKRILLFKVKRYRIYIEKDYKWPIYLLHEITHQILMKEKNYSGHGKIFKKLFVSLADRYFLIFTEITNADVI